MPELRFKETDLQDQFYRQTKPRVRETVIALKDYLWKEFRYLPTVTAVLVNKEPPSWYHAEGLAVDLRGKDMTAEIMAHAIMYCLKHFPRHTKGVFGDVLRTALSCYVHGTGAYLHLHISQDV